MSKRALTSYLSSLKKKELEEQLIDLYTRFPLVKEYYDFVFNPKEDKLIQEAKTKIANEYFPVKRRKPKARRSTAHKYLKHFLKLGVNPLLIADLMLFNIEIAQSFSLEKKVSDPFYKSMLNSFKEALQFIALHSFVLEYKDRIVKIYHFTQEEDWLYKEEFSKNLDIID